MNSDGGGEMYCLLNNISFNTERIFHLLECRFKTNSLRTSFDFKSFPPEQPANNIKLSQSSLKFHPTVIQSIENDDESVSSESSNDEDEEISSPKSANDHDEDDYLNRLAQWEPDKNSPIVESEEEEEEEIEDNVQSMNEEIIQINSLNLPTGKFRSEGNDRNIHFRNADN
jgi:hypothetical protein